MKNNIHRWVNTVLILSLIGTVYHYADKKESMKSCEQRMYEYLKGETDG